jgi:hypothetical protein
LEEIIMLNQVDNSKRALHSRAAHSAAGVAWRCNTCHVWWGSQNSSAPTTQFLTRLPKELEEKLPWDEYRGWKLSVEQAGICPECARPSGLVVYAAA